MSGTSIDHPYALQVISLLLSSIPVIAVFGLMVAGRFERRPPLRHQ